MLEHGILTYAKTQQDLIKGEIKVFAIHELEYVKKGRVADFEVRPDLALLSTRIPRAPSTAVI